MADPVKIDWSVSYIDDLLYQFREKNQSSWYLDQLEILAKDCEHITEFGTFQGQTAALWLSLEKCKHVRCYDIDYQYCNKEWLNTYARNQGKEIIFYDVDPIYAEKIEQTDFLFLDTKHT